MTSAHTRLRRKVVLELRRRYPASFWVSSPPGSQTGLPDITGCLNGRYVGIEIKVPPDKLRPLQALTLNNIKAAGGIAFVAKGVDDLILLAPLEKNTLPHPYDGTIVRDASCSHPGK